MLKILSQLLRFLHKHQSVSQGPVMSCVPHKCGYLLKYFDTFCYCNSVFSGITAIIHSLPVFPSYKIFLSILIQKTATRRVEESSRIPGLLRAGSAMQSLCDSGPQFQHQLSGTNNLSCPRLRTGSSCELVTVETS